jgi:hypothetical protein
MRAFHCPLCSELRELRIDKNQKPYLICDSCGVQLFVRKDSGIRRLETLLKVSGPAAGERSDERLFQI